MKYNKRIRQSFLNFFKNKSHEILRSAPIVIKNDPSLMFTNAGMNIFKKNFLGQEKPYYLRVAKTQKCLRVSGKHNDIEDVGYDMYHHTMFEMLGNFSFGDYFKKEAIEFAWELLTEIYKISRENIYVTIFEGDEKDLLPRDIESYKYWKNLLCQEHILDFGKKENFWEMSNIGPCGPCSEIHIDLRSKKEKNLLPGEKLINKNHPKVIELWNLVFIEFYRKSDGSLEKLGASYIDTGMGFERLCRILQGKLSNYDTDIFIPLIYTSERISNVKYGENTKKDIAIRILVDHIRAVAFAIADGQNPSNTGAGYVIRRLLRRAVSYGYSILNQKEPFIYKLVYTLTKEMGDTFTEISSHRTWIEEQVKYEEKDFFKTLSNGIKRMEVIIQEHQDKKCIGGAKIFELYDTYGFPIDLSRLLAKSNALNIDEKGFEKYLLAQRARSRKDAKIQREDWIIVKSCSFIAEENFVGYDFLKIKTYINRYRRIITSNKIIYQIVLIQTPFYAESGGQVGDIGYLESESEKIKVLNTIQDNGFVCHITEKIPKYPEKVFKAKVDKNSRKKIEKNHSATHLLHKVLIKILGKQVLQKGSYICPDYFRFDFSHFKKITFDKLKIIEEYVQKMIDENLLVQEERNIPFDRAISKGPIALFGEQYGNKVRLIGFGTSLELCKGTHVKRSGEIGLFKIISEYSIGSGIRRIEAITSKTAVNYLNKIENNYNMLLNNMNSPKDAMKYLQRLKEENKKLRTQIYAITSCKIKKLKEFWLKIAKKKGNTFIISELTSLAPNYMKKIAFELCKEKEELAVILLNKKKYEFIICVALSEVLVKKGLSSSNIIYSIVGKGGGTNFLAMAEGNYTKVVDKALKIFSDFIKY